MDITGTSGPNKGKTILAIYEQKGDTLRICYDLSGKKGECPDGPAKPGGGYEEIALFGAGAGGGVAFWSFTSDGKRNQGASADVMDLHPEAVGFEAQMPAGLARMAYWPDGAGGFFFA